MYLSSAVASGTGVMGLGRPGMMPERSGAVGTVADSSSGLELRTPEAVRKGVSFRWGLVSRGMNGAPMRVMPKRLEPEAGCCWGWPRRLKGSAFRAEFEPVQKTAPCG